MRVEHSGNLYCEPNLLGSRFSSGYELIVHITDLQLTGAILDLDFC